jgi:hypothetical protein
MMHHSQRGDITTTLTIIAMVAVTLGLLIGSRMVAQQELTGRTSFAQSPSISPNQANLDASLVTMTFGPIINRNENQKWVTGNICFKPEGSNPPNTGAYYVRAYAQVAGQGPLEVGSSLINQVFGQRNAFECPQQRKYDLFMYRNLHNVPGIPSGATINDVQSIEIHITTVSGDWEPTMSNPVAVINNPGSIFDKTPGSGGATATPAPTGPTATPTITPTAAPTAVPSATPTVTPTAGPTAVPSATPTITPTPGAIGTSIRVTLPIIHTYPTNIVELTLEACANGVECLSSTVEVDIPPRVRALVYFTFNFESPTVNFLLLKSLSGKLAAGLSEQSINGNTFRKDLTINIASGEDVLLYVSAGEGGITSQAKTESQASDVSADGCVNVNDAALLIPKLGTVEESLTACSVTDIDCNGFNNALDLSYIISNLNQGLGCVYNQP